MKLVPMLIAGLLLAPACDGGEPAPGPTPDALVGTWGGKDAGFIVDDTSAHGHIGCTYGNVHQPIVTGLGGWFDVPGEYNITAHPVDLGVLHPARFTGWTDGRVMLLTVALTDTAVRLGPVRLVLGQEPGMVICPICRRPSSK